MTKDNISCQVLTIENSEEVFIGNIHVYAVPRKGEYIWFSEKRNGHTSWIVEDVAHHVGDGVHIYPNGYQTVVIYAKPTIQE